MYSKFVSISLLIQTGEDQNQPSGRVNQPSGRGRVEMNLQEDEQDKEESSTEDTEDNYSCDEQNDQPEGD